MTGWLELALDYRCNLACIGCRANVDNGESLSGPRVRALLESAPERKLWIGGGEPTLRHDLLAIVATAKRLRYERILLQTNGMRLSYPAYVTALVAAGVTDVSLNVKSHRADVHDALSRYQGCHALLLRALANLEGREIRVAADLLVTRTNAAELPETVRAFAALGVGRFTLWWLSAADLLTEEVVREVPRIADVPLAAASAVASELDVELVSMHTPPCTLPTEARHRYLPARALQLRVVDASGRSFPLETSPFEGGDFRAPCDDCSARPQCSGPRADYLRLHGDEELVAI